MRHFLQLALAAALVVTGLTSCATPSPSRQAFPELDAELQRQKKAGSQIVYPAVTHQVKPDYPAMRATGSVWGVMKVSPTGTVEAVKVVGEAPELYQEAIQKALHQWQFKPGSLQGKPATFAMQVKITFIPDASKAKEAAKGSKAKQDIGITFEPHSTITRSLFPELTEVIEYHMQAGHKIELGKSWKMSPPAYPKAVREKGGQGSLWVAFIIDSSGRAQSIHVVGECPKELQESILKAVTAGRGEPARINGKPHAMPAAVKMTFILR
ncbi:MAG: TonB family protein [Verrucomicrobiota bacterium]